MTEDIAKRPFAVPRVAVAASGIALLFALLLIPLPASINGSRLLGALANAFHGPLFACVGGLLLWLRGSNSWRGYLAAWLIAAGLALLTELVQSLGSRDPSWVDVRTDLLGAAAAVALWPLWLQRRSPIPRRRRAALAGVAVVAMILILLPVMQQLAARIERAQRFPVLFSAQFAAALAMTESMTEDEDVEITLRDGALSVALLAGPLPGVVLTDFAPDWRAYQALVVEVENPGAAPLSLEVHLRDRGSSDDPLDRFNARSQLLPGQRVPLRFALSDVAAGPRGRPMRIDAMKIIAVYRTEPGADRLLLHAVRLE